VNLLVGESFDWRISPKNNKAYIVAPGGKIIIPPSVDGKIIFKDTYIPGVYQLYRNPRVSNSESKTSTPANLPYGAEPAGSFTVNIDPKESFQLRYLMRKLIIYCLKRMLFSRVVPESYPE